MKRALVIMLAVLAVVSVVGLRLFFFIGSASGQEEDQITQILEQAFRKDPTAVEKRGLTISADWSATNNIGSSTLFAKFREE